MQEVLVSKIFNYTSTPTKNVEGQFWFNPSTNVLSRFNGTIWKPISVSSDDVAVLSDGSKVSLTSYLNTQIAALAEGIDSKQDKLKFYSEVDESNDPSTYSTGSEINLKTLASQYGGSSINLTASSGQYNPGGIYLKAKSFDTSLGGNIKLETEGGGSSGGNITLHSKFNSSGNAEPGGKISLIADGNSNANSESNILLSANNIQLDGNLKGTTLNTSIPADPDDNHILTTKAVKTELDKKQNILETYKEKQGDEQGNTIISSSVWSNGSRTGDIIIRTNGLDDTGGAAGSGDITISTGKSSGAGGTITLTTGDAIQAPSGSGASLVLDHASDNGNITLSAGAGPATPGNITLEAASGNLELNVAKITGSAVDTTIGSSSTDNHIPTSKAVYDATAALSEDISNKQDSTDTALNTTDKTIVGAINELSADKQDTLQFYTESITNASGAPAPGMYQEQISLGKSNYGQTINIGGTNYIQRINLGGGGTHSIITIGGTTSNNEIQIGRTDAFTALEINANTINGNIIDKTALTESSCKLPTSQAVLNGLSAKQNTTDNNLTTTDKTIVGAINELSTNKQNTLKYFSESDSSTVPSSNNAQVSILKSSDYQTTLNLGFESSNGVQTVNIGGSSNDRRINIGTKTCGSYNNVTIGNASDGVLLTLNTGRGLAGTGVTKDLSTSATDAQFPTAAAVNNQLILKQNITDNSLTTTDKTIPGAINEIENKVLDSHLSKLPYGTLYFNNAKLFGSNFAIPNFPFSICATVRVDSWEGSTQGIQTIFQFGDNRTGTLWGSIWFNNVINNPNICLRISKNTDGTISYSEVSYPLKTNTFLGKEHTIIGVCRELTSTPVNFDIYVDGTKVATSPYKGLTLDSLSGTVNYAVNTYNANYSMQPASAHPMMLRNLYVFNFDVSAEGSPYTIADYAAGKLIPPALKPSQVSLALENYTIARNATTKLVKDASGNSNDATVQGDGTVAGDNDQSIKAFVDEIKTQINQSNG